MSATTRVAGRYAKSLIDLARERGKFDVVTENIRHFHTSTQNRDLRVLLASPVISPEKKNKVMDALFGDYDEITRAFLRIVIDKHREEALPEIAEAYLEQYREERGISVVSLRSAAPLDRSAVEAIKRKLVDQGMTTERIELTEEVDPELLGGFVLQVGDKLWDASAKSQLNTLRKEFTGNAYQRNVR